MNILFTCAGRRTYLLKYFRENLSKGDKIIATDMQLTAPALQAADVRIQVPSVYDANYVDITLDICKKHEVSILISLNDLELPILAKNKVCFEKAGVHVIVSDPEVIEICFDKYKTYQYIKSLNLECPKTFKNYNEAILAIKNKELIFPLVLKPRWGSGSIGIEFVDDMEEFQIAYNLLRKKIKKTILSKASIGNEYILIQEKIEGYEYGLDIMNDLKGNHIAVSVKKKLSMRAGETDKAITIENHEIQSIGKKIGTNLKHIGNLDCDILERNEIYYVLELNPRFGGGFPFSYEAGVNLPGAIISWAKGLNFNTSNLNPKDGKLFAKCDYLIEIPTSSE